MLKAYLILSESVLKSAFSHHKVILLSLFCRFKICLCASSFLKKEWTYLNEKETSSNCPIDDSIWKNLHRKIEKKVITVSSFLSRQNVECIVVLFREFCKNICVFKLFFKTTVKVVYEVETGCTVVLEKKFCTWVFLKNALLFIVFFFQVWEIYFLYKPGSCE